MAKKQKLTTLKKKAWALFSKYVRLNEADENGYCKCVTCDNVLHWKQMQAGHFVPGRCNSILFEKNGVHSQCRRCNYNEGNGPEYFIFMEKTYGREEIDRLRTLRHQTVKRTPEYYLEMIKDLTRKVEALIEEKA